MTWELLAVLAILSTIVGTITGGISYYKKLSENKRKEEADKHERGQRKKL